MNGAYVVTANGVMAICAVFTLAGAGLAIYVELSIRRAFDKLNGRYIRQELCQERHGETVRRLTVLEG